MTLHAVIWAIIVTQVTVFLKDRGHDLFWPGYYPVTTVPEWLLRAQEKVREYVIPEFDDIGNWRNRSFFLNPQLFPWTVADITGYYKISIV